MELNNKIYEVMLKEIAKRCSIIFLCLVIVIGMVGCSERTSEVRPIEPVMNALDYDTVNDLCNGILTDFEEEFFQEYEGKIGSKKGRPFREFITNRKTEKTIIVPYFKDEQIVLRDEAGYSNIALFTSELFGQPSIWFFPLIDKSNTYIAITYLDMLLSDEIIEEAKEKGGSWLLKQIDSTFPNADNYRWNAEYISSFKNIYEKEFILQNKKVKAMVREDYGDTRLLLFFSYDDLLIRMCIEPKNMTAEWLESLDFRPVELKQAVVE